MYKISNLFQIILILALFLTTVVTLADAPQTSDVSNDIAPPSVGNFIFPSSQQPGPLVSFGQNIIDPHQTQIFLMGDYFNKNGGYASDFLPSLLYGVTDRFSVFFTFPLSIRDKNGLYQSSGPEDAFLQLEYAFYAKQTYEFAEQATILTNMTFPTGSSTENPSTGLGAPSFFLGTTFNRTYENWFGFTSYGVILPASHNGDQAGNQFLYQTGLGRNIMDSGSKWILAWVLEATGQYAEKNKVNGEINPNSGGNIVYLTPSLWFSSKKFVFQPGISLPVIQHLPGNQPKTNYGFVLNLGWTL